MALEDSSSDSGLNPCIWQLVSAAPGSLITSSGPHSYPCTCHKAHVHIKQETHKYLKCGMTLTAKSDTDKDIRAM